MLIHIILYTYKPIQAKLSNAKFYKKILITDALAMIPRI